MTRFETRFGRRLRDLMFGTNCPHDGVPLLEEVVWDEALREVGRRYRCRLALVNGSVTIVSDSV